MNISTRYRVFVGRRGRRARQPITPRSRTREAALRPGRRSDVELFFRGKDNRMMVATYTATGDSLLRISRLRRVRHTTSGHNGPAMIELG